MNKLSNDRIAEIARQNGIQPAALLAVKLIESGQRSGFLDSGNPQVLFEGHIFYKLLIQNRKDLKISELMAKNKNIIYPKWTKIYYNGGEGEWQRLMKARQIDKNLADQSASWGMFQIMGFNFKTTGCKSIEEFVEKMCSGPEAQLQLTVNFIKKNGMDKLLNQHQWAKFAKGYNGSGYAANKYDVKLQAAYTNYSRIYPK